MDQTQILVFYRELLQHINLNKYHLIRLTSKDIKRDLLQIKKERVNAAGEEVWYQLMMDYINQSPYGKLFPCKAENDFVMYFTRRIQAEDEVIHELLTDYSSVIESKNYNITALYKKINMK